MILFLSHCSVGCWFNDCSFFASKLWVIPLNKIKQALFKIRNGDKKKLEAQYPLEVQPLSN